MFSKSKLALLVVLAQGLSSAAQSLIGGPLGYACFPQASDAAPPITCPPEPVTFLDSYYYSQCICYDMTDPEGDSFVYCTSAQQPAPGLPSFSNFCGSQLQVAIGSTCSSINDIDSISNSACSDTDDVSKVMGFLCDSKSPASKVKNVMDDFEVGIVVVGLLDVACAASPVAQDAKTVCSGIGALASACPAGSSGGSGSSAADTSSAMSLASSPSILTLFTGLLYWIA